LLKDFDHSGFVFYTNTQSRKGEELTQNQNVALCFYWMPIRRQIRIEGVAALVPDAQADAYFKTRVREKQIGAWASIQSQPMPGPEALDARITKYEARFARLDVPRPPHWSGYLVTPHTIEFWHERPFRLHERTRYLREGEAWKMERLYP
jgi:pyridoxamine 5'-phosphate oxidase